MTGQPGCRRAWVTLADSVRPVLLGKPPGGSAPRCCPAGRRVGQRVELDDAAPAARQQSRVFGVAEGTPARRDRHHRRTVDRGPRRHPGRHGSGRHSGGGQCDDGSPRRRRAIRSVIAATAASWPGARALTAVTRPRCRDGTAISSTGASRRATGIPTAARLAQHLFMAHRADPVEDHPADPMARRGGSRNPATERRCCGLAAGSPPAPPGAPEQFGDVR